MSSAACLVLFFLAANPCSNGSFEDIAANGAPVDWDILNQGSIVEGDVHSGQRALRLVRAANDPVPETGLNRHWVPKSGEQGAMIDRVKGGMEFWYKAAAGSNDNVRFAVIPMDATAWENTAATRTEYVVPKGHIGDGAWHRGRLKYDYTNFSDVKWVHFAVRITGGAGEMLVDDIAYVDSVGAVLSIEGIRLEESATKPGEEATLRARICNKGDAAATGIDVRVLGSPSLGVTPSERRIDALAPDAETPIEWAVAGPRIQADTLTVRASGSGDEASATLAYAPDLTLVDFGPVSPVYALGEDVTLECVVKNDGSAILAAPSALFTYPGNEARVIGANLPPGASAILRTTLRPTKESPSLLAGVTVAADNLDAAPKDETRVVIGSSEALPVPAEGPLAEAKEAYAIVQNEHARLAFKRNTFGFGPGELQVKSADGWRRLAWMPSLSVLSSVDDQEQHRTTTLFPQSASRVEDEGKPGIAFQWSEHDADGVQWDATMRFTIGPTPRTIKAVYELRCSRDRSLLRFNGPMLYTLDRDEASVPGLEWLVGDEVSSNTLDIEKGHPHQVRYVPHPNMVTIPAVGIHGAQGTTGLLWNQRQTWDGTHDRPALVFASPDRFNGQRAHLMGLEVPNVPEFLDPNTRLAERPYPLRAGAPLRIECLLYADSNAADALAPMDEWFKVYGFPQPAPLPRGSYENEIAFSMRAYFESLWDAPTQSWWTTKHGHPLLSQKLRQPPYVADLLLGSMLSATPETRDACRAKAAEMAALMGFEPRIDVARSGGNADYGVSGCGIVASLLAARSGDGLWRFDADRKDMGVFKGFDYHILGENNAVAVGTCADKMRTVMRYALIAGDEAAYRAVTNVLEYMETERVPRASQVWEVPFHAPDVLAAAYAVDVYLAAYRFSGDARWLNDAVTWARRGLPFIYFWDDPGKPYVLGGSIPVYGASLRQYSWFGRIVQWNGLCLANAYLDLAPLDTSYPWRQIAETMVRSAMYQQAADGEDVALWPDSISAIEGDKSAWVFAPRQILSSVTKLLGRDEAPQTTVLRDADARIHITTIGTISDAARNGGTLEFTAAFPDGEENPVLVANIAKPASIMVNGAPLPERPSVNSGKESGWSYDPALGFAVIRTGVSPRVSVRVEGAGYRAVDRLPEPTSDIAFEFNDSVEGWQAAHDIVDMAASDGALVGTFTGGDPFLIRGMLTVAPGRYSAIEIRLRASAGHDAQFYWGTADAPGFSEDRVRKFDIVADGAFHTYRIDLAKDPQWTEQKVTAIRIDPINGAAAGDFAIDYVRGLS